MPRKNDLGQELAARKRVQDLASARAEPTNARRLQVETRLTRTWIDAGLLADEPALQELAWVEYLFMTPLERTERFAAEYLAAYRNALATHFPEIDAGARQPIKSSYVANDLGVMNALWRARREADKLGVSYDVYLAEVLRGLLVGDKWKRPPRPNQLYGKLSEPRLRGLPTLEQIKDRLFGPDWDSRFSAKDYSGHPAQEEALLLMRQVVQAAPQPDEALADYLGDKQAITLERATDLFGPEAVQRASAMAVKKPVSRVPVPRAHVPACVGLINTAEDSICKECPVCSQCAGFKQRVTNDMVVLLGTADPRADWKRQKTKLRMRRMRNKGQEFSVDRLLDRDVPAPHTTGDAPKSPEA